MGKKASRRIPAVGGKVQISPDIALPDWALNPQFEGPSEPSNVRKEAGYFGGPTPDSRLRGPGDPRNVGEYYAGKGDPRYDALRKPDAPTVSTPRPDRGDVWANLAYAILGPAEIEAANATAQPLPSWVPQDQAYNNNYTTGYKNLDDAWGYSQGNHISEMSKRAPVRDVSTAQLEQTKVSPKATRQSSGNEYLKRLVNSTSKNPQTEVSKALRAKGE